MGKYSLRYPHLYTCCLVYIYHIIVVIFKCGNLQKIKKDNITVITFVMHFLGSDYTFFCAVYQTVYILYLYLCVAVAFTLIYYCISSAQPLCSIQKDLRQPLQTIAKYCAFSQLLHFALTAKKFSQRSPAVTCCLWCANTLKT